jgi:acetyl esterase/lipase
MRRGRFISLAVLTCLLAGACPRADAASLRRDVEYGCADGESLRLDVCSPDGPGPHPVAILVHGGGWSSGDKAGAEKPGSGADITPWFAPLTRAGFVWVSINYRLAPAHPWPAGFSDVQTAIRWVKAHAAEFGGDPARIVLFGHSAGGQLACLAAVTANDDTRVQALVGCAAVTDLELDSVARGGLSRSLQDLFHLSPALTPPVRELLRAQSPVHRIGGRPPPCLLLHGDADKTVALQQSRNFRDALLAAGGTCELWVLPGAGHRLASWDKADPAYPEKMTVWLQQVLRSAPGAAPTLSKP